ncbi:Sulfotransferase [uncultured virus]|nr:Sulfotransferase [uncultured virus]
MALGMVVDTLDATPRQDSLWGIETGDAGSTPIILHHLTAAEIRERIGTFSFESYFKFAVVRNPWDRLVSEYAWRRWRSSESFREFVRSLTDDRAPRDFELIAHLRPQLDYLLDPATGKILVDFVGRFETLDADFSAVCDRIGRKAPLPRQNRSEHEMYRALYDEETRDIVARVFAKDIEAFRYTF